MKVPLRTKSRKYFDSAFSHQILPMKNRKLPLEEISHTLKVHAPELEEAFRGLYQEWKYTEEQLEAQKEQMRLVLSGVNVGVWEWPDMQRDKLHLSERFYHMLDSKHYPLKPSLKGILQRTHPNDRKRLMQAFDKHRKEEDSPLDVEVRIRFEEGIYRWFRINGQSLRDQHGAVHRIAGSIMDINTRKRAEQHIKKLNNQLAISNEELSFRNKTLQKAMEEVRLVNERLDLVISGVKVGVWDWKEGTPDHWYFSKQTYDMLGLRPQETSSGRSLILARIHPKDRRKLDDNLRQHLRFGRIYEVKVRLRCESDTYRWFQLNGASVRNKAGRVIRMAGSIMDIHAEEEALEHVWKLKRELEARVQARTRAMAEAEAKWRRLISSAEDMILILDREGNIDFINHTHPETPLLSIRGKIFDYFDATMQRIKRQKFKAALTRKAESVRYESYITTEDKKKRIWFSNSLTPLLLDSKGEVLKLTLVARDITEQKAREQRLKEAYQILEEQNELLLLKEEENKKVQAQLLKANEQLSESQVSLQKTVGKLEARNNELDNLVYKISHDIRSPLSSMLGLLDLIKQKTLDEEVAQMIDFVENRAQRLDGFIRKMLDFARASRIERSTQPIELEEVVREILKDLNHYKHFKEIEQKIEIAPQVSTLYSDPLRIQIVLSNLISNAVKYQNPYRENKFLHVRIYKHSPIWLCIQVADNGIGVRKEHAQHVFEMFYRGTDATEGSGLGLYIVKQTVDQLGGKIDIETTYGEGTTMTLFLPNSDQRKPD